MGGTGGHALGDGFNALGGALTDQADAASHGFGPLGGALADETDATTVKSDALEEVPTALGEVSPDALDNDPGACGTISGASDSVRAAASGFASGVSGIRSVDDAADPSTDACAAGTESDSAEVRRSCPVGATGDFENGMLWSAEVDESAPALRRRYRRVTRRGSPDSAPLIDAVSIVAASTAGVDAGAGSSVSECASASDSFGDT